jgi:primosomal replication protein N
LDTSPRNHLVLTARINAIQQLRYTPAGLPALDLELEHESSVLEAGQTRQARAVVKAVAFAVQAERLAKQALGSGWTFSGFVAAGRNGKGLVFHIQGFEPLATHLNPI